ncbi:biosynthetic peptidoglycan transglycosylase [Defluviimonas salinarum]|uniref:Transglycosylase domain-containing protein n=1 Tax=Defluviimonas salinarum TaxID=2992147 RepID=A0ABT3IZH9_9RHOB|nr:biosynthetic peptidoglycan transglycosylase [Defluviimonas salinarum]MCW3780579.1 transglycosylase domain-containing protein [Defluviimonas salinarum]
MSFAEQACAEKANVPLLTTEEVRSDFEEHAKTWVSIPEVALNAIVAAEDPEFFSKPAQNSTITIQLGKRYIVVVMRSLLFRITAFHNATIMARELTHSEILNWYAQEVWLGNFCFGFPSAGKAYFGKDVGDLDVQDYALLAALVQTPMKYDPIRVPEKAMERRNQVLNKMQEAGFLTVSEATDAADTSLGIRQPAQGCELK